MSSLVDGDGPDESRLDDPAAIGAVDRSGMLRATATAAAQLRESYAVAADGRLAGLAGSQPRAVLVCGMGGSGIAGDVLAAVAGLAAPVPVLVHRGFGLPGWVGAADLVVGVSSSGATRETISAVEEARRRAARLVGVGAADSPLADLVASGRGEFVPVRSVLAPRASLWALATPLLVLADVLGLTRLGQPGPGDEPPEALEAAAARLEQIAVACRPDREGFVNPGKELALGLAGGLPLVWGSGQCGPVAALRLVCQLAENAKTPAVAGALPVAHHNQVVCLDGDGAGAGEGAGEDFFRDRVDDAQNRRPQVVVLRDDAGDERSAGGAAAVEEVAQARGMRTTVISAQGESPVERLASLAALGDFASVYLAIARGIDPTPISAIDDLKQRLGSPSG
jgi:glucose/mannose-6-phosphate isomerase